MLKHLVTFDPYYDIDRYTDVTYALKNNGIEYEEYISTKPPFNWYINCDTLPAFINYDEASKNEDRFLVTKVKPLRPNEEYLLKRRETDGSGVAGIHKFIYNDVFKNTKGKYAFCFRYKSKIELFDITRTIKNTKIFLIGKYKGWNLAITYNKYVHNEVQPDYFVLEKQENDMNEVGEFERMINYKGLKKKDKIVKYTQTAYIKDGKYFPTKINI